MLINQINVMVSFLVLFYIYPNKLFQINLIMHVVETYFKNHYVLTINIIIIY